MDNQLVTVWGSPGAGTTLTSIKIAKELAKEKKDTIIVHCDNTVPTLPLLMPKAQDSASLGDLLSQDSITQIDVYKHCMSLNSNIAVLGYAYGENETTYVPYDTTKAKHLLQVLRSLADYIIIDGYHSVMQNALTVAALEASDCVIKILNADLKSAVFLNSQKLLLTDERFKFEKHVNILNNVWKGQPTAQYEQMLGKVLCTFPHLESLREQFNTHSLLESLIGRDAKYYNPLIRQLVWEVFLKHDE